jgi:hypothetical protein
MDNAQFTTHKHTQHEYNSIPTQINQNQKEFRQKLSEGCGEESESEEGFSPRVRKSE